MYPSHRIRGSGFGLLACFLYVCIYVCTLVAVRDRTGWEMNVVRDGTICSARMMKMKMKMMVWCVVYLTAPLINMDRYMYVCMSGWMDGWITWTVRTLATSFVVEGSLMSMRWWRSSTLCARKQISCSFFFLNSNGMKPEITTTIFE